MKKLIFINLIIVFVLFLTPKVISAMGTIQLVDFPKQFNTTVNSKFSIPINFIYSGDHANQLGVSVIGSTLPSGVSLGSIYYGNNGIDSISLSGIPTQSGGYTLTLVITDNNGAVLATPSFLFQVNAAPSINLPDAIVNKSYSQNIFIASYNADAEKNLIVNFSTTSNDFLIQSIHSKLNNGYATLNLMPLRVGAFTIKAETTDINGEIVDTRFFTFNIINQPIINQSNQQDDSQLIQQLLKIIAQLQAQINAILIQRGLAK